MRAGGTIAQATAADTMTAATASYHQMKILRAVAAVASLDGHGREKPIMVIEELRSQDWASATFIGQRHELDLRIDGKAAAVAAAASRLTAELANHEVPLPGYFIAELAVLPGVCARRTNVMVTQ